LFSDHWTRKIKIPKQPIEDASEDTLTYAVSERSQLIFLALSQLAHQRENWFKASELDATDLEDIEDWSSLAEAQLLNPVTSESIGPPYWDTPADADADPDVDTGFPWYEDLSFEIIEGFLATLVSAPAAHSYITAVKKLRLVYLRGSSGGNFNVEVDGDHVATIDTYAATDEIAYTDVIIP